MFYLRIIEETRKDESSPFEQVITNYELGNSYSVLRKGITEEFEKNMDYYFKELKEDGISALLCGENGLKFFIMEETELKTFAYFIMTETGKTFEKIATK
jgi:predicted peroxiredoxin